ncbi:unnamed protein product [Adineta steineri]|uniref:Amine oxidase n=2 Tax=Adineta steineri TaxID=433720 RepID=A0A814ZJH3_9BILA|nr:unnamed protein product [Adineta steineri]CAF3562032.1 unnamed protein product [Adineta steineri]
MDTLEKGRSISDISNINTSQVLIIGAGLSGLEAARLLREKGIKTIILEARNRTGGRIWSVRSKTGHMFDTGATWIHGIYGSIPNGLLSNPLWDLTQEAKIPTRGTDIYDIHVGYPFDGNISETYNWYNEYLSFTKEETRMSSPNISLAYYADLYVKQKNLTDKQQHAFYSYLAFTIKFNEGAELNAIGAKNFLSLSSSHYGDEHIFHKTGFMALTDYLARDIDDIRFNQVINKITYNDKMVEVRTKNGKIYQSSFVLLTVPLGVLKAKEIEFIPQLPQWKLDAIDRIGYGFFEKVFLVWEQAWWNSTNFYFMGMSSNPNNVRYWVNANKWNDKPVLIYFLAGQADFPTRLKENHDELIEELRRNLQEMFPDFVVPPPVETFVTHWNEDPFSYGSYSYISVNQTYEDSLFLSEPIQDRLLFAGEATSIDSYGYAHGALLSARREVTRLLYGYELLPIKNITTSQSILITPLTILFIIQFIFLSFFYY